MGGRIIRVLVLSAVCLCAAAVVVLWARSYEPPGPRLIEGPVLARYTNLPRQLVLYYPDDRACIYGSVLNGWIRIGRIDIQSPYGLAPREDGEAWAWLGNARFPDPTLIVSPVVTRWIFGLVVSCSIPMGSALIRGVAFPCWLILAILLFPVCLKTFRVLRRQFRPGYCVKCAYNLAGLTEPRCPECGTEF